MDFRAFLDTRTVDQLKEINNIVVGKINALDGGAGYRPPASSRSLVAEALAKFKVGDLVEFRDKRGIKHQARIKSLNTKTATCIEDLGRGETNPRWRVSPSFLRLVGEHPEAVSTPTLPSAWPGLSAEAAAAPKIDAAKPTAAHAGTW